MASAVLASSVAVRGTPLAPTAAGKRTPVRAARGRAVVTRAGEIAGLTECGKFQELCKAEIPGKIPRCVVFFACMAKVVQGVQCLDTTETERLRNRTGNSTKDEHTDLEREHSLFRDAFFCNANRGQTPR